MFRGPCADTCKRHRDLSHWASRYSSLRAVHTLLHRGVTLGPDFYLCVCVWGGGGGPNVCLLVGKGGRPLHVGRGKRAPTPAGREKEGGGGQTPVRRERGELLQGGKGGTKAPTGGERGGNQLLHGGKRGGGGTQTPARRERVGTQTPARRENCVCVLGGGGGAQTPVERKSGADCWSH